MDVASVSELETIFTIAVLILVTVEQHILCRSQKPTRKFADAIQITRFIVGVRMNDGIALEAERWLLDDENNASLRRTIIK